MDAIAGVDPWEEKALEEKTQAWLLGLGLAIKDVAQPARVALTGRAASPGLFEVLAVLGKGVALERLKRGIERAQA